MAEAKEKAAKPGQAQEPTFQEKAKKFFAFLRGPQDIVGVDIGTYAVKLVKFNTQTGALECWGHLPLEFAAEATPEEKNAKTAKLIKDFVHAKQLHSVTAATSVSGTSVIVRYGKFPAQAKEDLAKTIPTEAEPLIPFDIKEAILSFYVLGEVEEEGSMLADVVLAASKRDIVQQHVDVLKMAGLPPHIVDVDAFSLENLHASMAPPEGEPGGALYLNIGHQVTNLSIIESPGVTRVARDVFIAGLSFTRGCQKALQGDAAAAEAAKRKHGILATAEEKEQALSEGNREALAVSQALSKAADELLKEVHRSVDYYLSQGTERSIARVVLTGGSANLKGLAPYMSNELKVPVEVLNPFAFLPDKGAAVEAEALPALAVATGLALRKLKDWL